MLSATSDAGPDWLFAYNANTLGVVSLGIVDSEPLIESTKMITLRFQMVEKDLTLEIDALNGSINEGAFPLLITGTTPVNVNKIFLLMLTR